MLDELVLERVFPRAALNISACSCLCEHSIASPCRLPFTDCHPRRMGPHLRHSFINTCARNLALLASRSPSSRPSSHLYRQVLRPYWMRKSEPCSSGHHQATEEQY
jgi:hypothetical protein